MEHPPIWLQVLVSTNGNGLRPAALIKQRIEAALPEPVEDAVESVGRLRRRLRQRAPGVGGELGTRRMRWITVVCEAWALEDLALLECPSNVSGGCCWSTMLTRTHTVE